MIMTWLKRKEQKYLDKQEERKRKGIIDKPKGKNCLMNTNKREKMIDVIKKALG